MQVRLNGGMTRSLDTLGARVRHARQQRGMTQAQLAKASELGQSDISKIERSEIQQTTGIARLAGALSVDSLWLERGEGAAPDWTSVHPPIRGVAQDMSQIRPTLSLPKVAWEDLDMGQKPSQPFELEVIDGAFGGDIPPGCVMRMDPHREPRAGWPVLVKDKDGRHYLRDYQQAGGGRWQAVARTRGFAPMDSLDDGLEVVAVMRGVDWP